jgi:hypothetical protein
MHENRRDFATAKKLRETFVDRPMKKVIDLEWSWPRSMDEIGVCTAVMYKSDKWHEIGDFEDYKHINESGEDSHKLLIAKNFELGLPKGADVFTENCDLDRMPDSLAELAEILGLQFRLYDEYGKLGDEYWQVNIVRAKIGAAKHPNGETMLLVYTKSTLCCLITGFEVEKDGIVR